MDEVQVKQERNGIQIHLRNFPVQRAQQNIRQELVRRLEAQQNEEGERNENLDDSIEEGEIRSENAIVRVPDDIVSGDSEQPGDHDSGDDSDIWRALGIVEQEEAVQEEEEEGSLFSEAEGSSNTPVLNRRQSANVEENRHSRSEIDPLNRLYESNRDGNDADGDDWYLTNNKRDVCTSLSFYTVSPSRKRTMIGTEEKITMRSSGTRLLTNKLRPLVIYYNQTYKPMFAKLDGIIVCRCTNRFPSEEQLKSCPGSITCNKDTGEVRLHQECTHGSRRDSISLELILQKMTVLYKNQCTMERIYENASALADSFGVLQDLWTREATSRKILGKLRLPTTNSYPPAFDWDRIDNVICIRDTSGTFEVNNNMLLVWMVTGADVHIRNAKVVNVDGKFSKIPTGFQQIYCISCKDPASDVQIPLIFALTNSKTQVLYEELFSACRDVGLNPEKLYSDFEKAVMNAALVVWPLIEVMGCWRHWKVAIYKKMRKLVTPEVAKTADFVNLRKSLYGLSFAPFQHVDAWFRLLRGRTRLLHARMDEYFDYLTNTYFGSNAMFEMSLWHCERRSHYGHDFTNNGSEQIFSKYARLYNHSNYKVLRVAVEKSVIWTQSVYRDVNSQQTWLNRRRSDRPPLYRNQDFHAVTDRIHHNFRDFNASIHAWMHDPKLFH